MHQRLVPILLPDAAVPVTVVGDLRLSFVTLGSGVPGHEVERTFIANPSLPGVVIADQGHLAGLIPREQFLSWMTEPFGPDLYRTRPIRRLLERSGRPPLCVGANDGVADAARAAMARPDDRIYDPLLVTFADGRFAVADMPDLLRAVAGVLQDQMQRIAETLDELRRTQSHLLQSEKMASLGALVAGVAHEVNTPVGIVLGTASHFADLTARFKDQMIQGRMRRSDLDGFVEQAAEAARLLSLNATRAADLIQSFKQVSVDQTSNQRRIFPLGRYIDEVLTSLTPAIRKTQITVAVACAETIECDTYPGALSQILTNLVMNSLNHAFDEGGTGTIRVTAEVEPGDWVRLVYTDNGRGIAEADAPRVFDPFFTTKRGMGGSGLGLHITYNLVHGVLGGEITLTTAPGAGVSFLIRFPRCANDKKR